MAESRPDFEPPNPRLASRRHIAPHVQEWVEEANGIMMANGSVQGRTVFRARHQARWRAQRLIGLMVDLDMHERWELAEHTYPRDGGWIWSVEYKGRRES